ncbi:BTB/POZ domain-containing protein 3-like [Paramacrobiotus metropolitanus]|uniref:BTB/POZ domain-containing protein 3-like n=1 Tax=Paramacrobiotus metropolitanus TaxID=2943436 RepID=UPI0024459CF8|nr:BTB/POZ domain-containing protein 3-like [Paramacrobiotus metropolitanus]
MKRTLTSGDLSDVRFFAGRDFGSAQNFSAHRFVLSSRNDVFRTMFYGSLPENCDKPVDIPDVHPDAFANMLSFVYADTVDGSVLTMYCIHHHELRR